jgi:hypothetical protein
VLATLGGLRGNSMSSDEASKGGWEQTGGKDCARGDWKRRLRGKIREKD